MREFKYDIIRLIHGIRDRPCLWDKTIDNYKDRVERRVAWEEIFNMLEENYEDMTAEQKRMTGEHILNKWTNIRDTFVKSLKSKLGRPKRRYIYYDHLKFLTKITPEECSIVDNEFTMNDSNEEIPYMKQEMESQVTEIPDIPDTTEVPKKRSKRSDFDDDKSSNYCVIESSYSQKKKSKRNDFDDLTSTPDYCSEESYSGKRKSKRLTEELSEGKESCTTKKTKSKRNSKHQNDDEDDIDLVEINEADNPRLMNEDEAFFASLLPTVVKYSEDERLEFRIEVLSVMRKIKDKRKWSND